MWEDVALLLNINKSARRLFAPFLEHATAVAMGPSGFVGTFEYWGCRSLSCYALQEWLKLIIRQQFRSVQLVL
jgi:hypothetical protein